MKYCIIVLLLFNFYYGYPQNNTLLYPVYENGLYKMIDDAGNTVKGPFSIFNDRDYSGYPDTYGIKAFSPFKPYLKFVKEGKMGVISSAGDLMADALYDTIGEIKGEKIFLAEFKKDKKWGVLTRNNKLLVHPEYDTLEILFYSDSVFYFNVNKNAQWTILDNTGKQMLPYMSDKKLRFGEYKKSFVITKNGKEGLCDLEGKIFFDYQFGYINTFVGDFALCSTEYNWHIINNKGKKVDIGKSERYPELYPKGLVQLKRNGKEWLINSDGKVLVSDAQEMGTYEYGMSYVKNKKPGFFDFHYNLVIPPIYSKIEYDYYAYYDHYHITVKQGNLCGAYDTSDKVVVPVIYEELEYSSLGIKFKKAGKWGIMSYDHKVIIPAVYSKIGYTDTTCFIYYSGKLCGLKGYNNNRMILATYEDIEYSGIKDVFIVKINGKRGLVDAYGKVITNVEYETIRLQKPYLTRDDGFFEYNYTYDYSIKVNSGLPADAFYVKKQGKMGIINSKGEIITPFKYYNINDFKNGLAYAEFDDKTEVINISGHVIQPRDTSQIEKYVIYDTIVKVKQRGKWGVIDKKSNWLIEPMYDTICDFDRNGYTLITENGKKGIIHISGNMLIPPVSSYLVGYMHKMGIIEENSDVSSYIDSKGKIVWKKSTKVRIEELKETFPEAICMHDEIEHLKIIGTPNPNSYEIKTLSLPECIYHLPKLKSLKIENCGIYSMSPSLKNLKTLKCLSLKSIGDSECVLGNDLKDLQLDTLELSGQVKLSNEIEALTGLKVLSNSGGYLPKMPSLITLHQSLSSDSIGENLFYSKNLKNIDLLFTGSKNIGFDWSMERTIYAPYNWTNYFLELSKFSSLQMLIINKHEEAYSETIESMSVFPKEFLELKSLSKLDLAVPKIDTVTDEIANWSNLHYLKIASSQQFIPNDISKLQLLDTLILKNELHFPNSVKRLLNLKYLDCSGDYLPSMPKLSFLKYYGDRLPSNITDSKLIDSLNISIAYNNEDSVVIAMLKNFILKATELPSLQMVQIAVYNLRSDIIKPLLDVVPFLSKMPKFKQLRIYADKLTDEEVQNLKKEFEKAEIMFEYISFDY